MMIMAWMKTTMESLIQRKATCYLVKQMTCLVFTQKAPVFTRVAISRALEGKSHIGASTPYMPYTHFPCC